MENEITSGNLESVRKGKRKCVAVTVVRSKNRARKPKVSRKRMVGK
jgi:hypothetical protein